MTTGRPSRYRPAYCETVKDFRTLAAFARSLGVDTQTVYNWMQKHPEFAAAVKAMARPQSPLYRDEYCDAVVEYLKDGHSLAAFAATIGVTTRSLYNWMARHPDFDDAVKVAQAKSLLWWERRLLELAQTKRGPAKAVIFGLMNRAKADWRDRAEADVQGKREGFTRIECVIVDPGHAEG